jgi:hypothetical protein
VLLVEARHFLVPARRPQVESDHQPSCGNAEEPIADVSLMSARHDGSVPQACRLRYQRRRCLGVFILCFWHWLSIWTGVSNCSASDDSEDSDHARRVYAPLPAQHHLENALGAYSTNDFCAVYADVRQMCAPIVTSKAESGVSCDTLVEAHTRLRHKERWDTFLAAL